MSQVVVNDARDPLHLSGRAIVSGEAKFIGDDVKSAGMLVARCVPSKYAHAKIVKIDTTAAAKVAGVIAVLTHHDVPGENQIGHTIKDEPLLPEDEVMYVGQPVAVVVATNASSAAAAMKLVHIEYQALTPILTIEDALQANSLYVPPTTIERGDIVTGFKQAAHVLTGEVNTQTQEHVYFETQRCWAIPGDDNNLTLFSATQATAEVQEIAARVLGLRSKDVTVDVRRLGGAFGGKERSATLWACLTALAAYVLKRPVELKLSRLEDLAYTGKRHPFNVKYKVGFTATGKILAYEIILSCNGGAFVDLSLPILQRAMFHADNAYYLPHVKIVGNACKTNLPPNTAFRGFGAPQGIFAIETIIEKIAAKLQLDPVVVRETNFYQVNETTPFGQPVINPCSRELLAILKTRTEYTNLLQTTAEFNRSHKYLKRGVGIVPVKFGISFTFTPLNQGTALIWIYADGSISMSHGGIEMGQEVNTKVAQVVAKELGVNLSRIRMESSNTQRNGNASPTAASTGSDINGNAALLAARQLKERLSAVAVALLNERLNVKVDATIKDNDATNDQIVVDYENLVFANDSVYDQRAPTTALDFSEVVHAAYMQRINLGAQGYYKTPDIFFDGAKMQGSPFYYFVYGVALTQVEVDLLTGANKLIKVYIVHECGNPLNKSVDRGQITGAYMQGFGYCTMEDMQFDATGKYPANTLSTYKIPTIADLPQDFAIELVELDAQHASVMGSKAVGEPPLIYGLGAYFAILHALQAAAPDKSIELMMPATPEAIVTAIKN